jgi:hypothetical protein
MESISIKNIRTKQNGTANRKGWTISQAKDGEKWQPQAT